MPKIESSESGSSPAIIAAGSPVAAAHESSDRSTLGAAPVKKTGAGARMRAYRKRIQLKTIERMGALKYQRPEVHQRELDGFVRTCLHCWHSKLRSSDFYCCRSGCGVEVTNIRNIERMQEQVWPV